MFDTMTLTKAVGGVCGTFLIFLLGGWAAESLYHVGPEGHGDEAAAQAYLIDTGASDTDDSSGPAVAFSDLLAQADIGKGESIFKKCSACHKLDGTNGTGPHLDGVVGREVASVPGFEYSAGMQDHGGSWTPEALNDFLTNPKKYISGTKMTFNGLPKETDRADIVAYLQTQSQ